TIWCQQLLSLIYFEEHCKRTDNLKTVDRVPFLEYNFRKMNFDERPSACLFSSHLPYYLVPRGLKTKKVKDLKSSFKKICEFLGKELREKTTDTIVRQATIQNMKCDPLANYDNMLNEKSWLKRTEGHFST
ncbi:Amine sulfotransferase, partial [Galemys pyrenaicus]